MKKPLPKAAEPYKFKKGVSGNPNGRIPSAALRALRSLTIDTYREVIELVLTGNIASLKEMIEDPDTPAIQVGVATSFMKAIKTGDYSIIERIAERIVGKIPDVVNINSTSNATVKGSFKIDKKELAAAFAELEKDV